MQKLIVLRITDISFRVRNWNELSDVQDAIGSFTEVKNKIPYGDCYTYPTIIGLSHRFFSKEMTFMFNDFIVPAKDFLKGKRLFKNDENEKERILLVL